MAWAERLPSGRYRGRYRDAQGVRRTVKGPGGKPLTFTHKARAERAASTAESKARRSAWSDPDAAQRTWGEWCDEWWPTRTVEPSTLKVDAGRRKVHLDPRWAVVPIGSIRRHDVRQWAAHMRRRGVGASTVQRAVHLLSASLAAAVDAEVLEANPAARLRLGQGAQAQERFLSHEEYVAALEQLPTRHDQLVAHMLAYTGLRWGEMAGLHRNRVDLDRGVLRVVETFDEKTGKIKAYPKGRRIRDVPLPDWLVELLRELLRELPIGPGTCGVEHAEGRCRSRLLLTTERGAVLRDSNWADIWRAAVERSGIGHTRVHDLRHTYASWLIQAGRPLEEVGALLGHISTSTTQKYAHLGELRTDAVKAALPQPRLDAPNLPQSGVDR